MREILCVLGELAAFWQWLVLTRLSSILIRASNSCSPKRLFCMGPKVLPAQRTEPTSWGRCLARSRMIRFSAPPALASADTYGQAPGEAADAAGWGQRQPRTCPRLPGCAGLSHLRHRAGGRDPAQLGTWSQGTTPAAETWRSPA